MDKTIFLICLWFVIIICSLGLIMLFGKPIKKEGLIRLLIAVTSGSIISYFLI